MRSNRLAARSALSLALAAAVSPAVAGYAHQPFHDRPLEVADLALQVLEGAPVPVPVPVPGDGPLAAAVAALLLVSELGLAEAYEEAVEAGAGEEGRAAYAAAHGLLQTVKPWIAALPQDAELTDLLARLDALMPGPERPAALDADPEAAEVLAQALVGRLERVADADLYLGRDLGRAMETVAQLAVQACASDPAARPRRVQIGALYFEDALEAPLSVLAAGPGERIEEGFAALHAGDLSVCGDMEDAFLAAHRMVFP